MKKGLLILFVILLIQCTSKRTLNNDEVLGFDNLKSAPSTFFGITNASGIEDWMGTTSLSAPGYPKRIIGFSPTLSSSTRYVYFDNTLSHDVTWFVNFKGRSSGAKKEYSGTSSEIKRKHFSWQGEADGYTFFQKGEIVDYTLSFLGSSISYKDSLQFTNSGAGVPTYNATSKILENGETLMYSMVDDFESSGGIKTSYADAADGVGKAVFYVNDQQRVNGHFQYYMKATDNNGNGYCGGSSGESLIELQNSTTEKDPSKVFINAYIYGYGRPNSSMFFQLFENDYANPANNAWPARDIAINDMWYTVVEVNWTGWKLVSIPYASFKPANNPKAGGGGNRIMEPHKFTGFGIELASYPTPGKTVELGLDLVTITTNGPFQP